MELSASQAAEIRRADVPVLLIRVSGTGRVLRLTGERTVIGRDPNCDLTLEFEGLGARHLLLQSDANGTEIFHLDGESTLLNGRSVEAAALENGDELRFGPVHAVYLDPRAEIMPPGFQILSLPHSILQERALAESSLRRPGSQDERFGDALIEALRRTPWLLVSGAIHAALYIVLLTLFETEIPPENTKPEIEVDMLAAEDAFAADEEFEPETEVPEDEIEEETPEIEEPQFEEDPRSDPDDTADYEEAPRMETPLSASTGRALGARGGDVIGGRGSLTGGAGERLRNRVRNLKASGLDLVILLDATGSMDAEIDAARRQVGTMIATLGALGIRFRLGVVAFRDEGEEFVTRSVPLTNHVYKAVDFLDGLSASGGGDIPEAVYDAFDVATHMRFASTAEKVLVLVGDAPPKPAKSDRLMRMVDRFHSRGGHVHTIYSETDSWAANWSRAKEVFSKIAQRGGGTTVELTNERRLIEDITRITLDSKDPAEVRKLFERLENGPRVQRIRRRLEQHDASFVAKFLRRKPLDPLIPLEVMRKNHEAFLGAYLEVLRDREVPLENRWLVTVLLRRLVAHIGTYHGLPDRARIAMKRFDPEEPRARQKRLLDELTRSLYDSGLLTAEARDR